jgi:hypothetical protein
MGRDGSLAEEKPAMLTAERVLDEYFLDNRCMLLEIGAMLDRYDAACRRDGRSPGDADPRLEKIYASLAILADRGAAADRAERLLTLFSDPAD